jgi:hypothetical protein
MFRQCGETYEKELADLPPDTETKRFSRFKTGFDLARAETLLNELAEKSSVLETLCHGEMTSSNVVYSERSGLRCIDWSDAFFGRPYLESLPLSRVIRVRGKQTKSEEAVMRVFHETGCESATIQRLCGALRPGALTSVPAEIRHGQAGVRIDPHSVEVGDLTEDIWELLVKAEKCLRYPQSCVDEEGFGCKMWTLTISRRTAAVMTPCGWQRRGCRGHCYRRSRRRHWEQRQCKRFQCAGCRRTQG